MSEIEKLYKNAGVEPEYDYFTAIKYPKIVQYFHLNKKELVDNIVDKIKYCKKNILIKVIRVDKDYPDFTAEKQLEIVKMILFSTWWMNLKRLQFSEKFDEGLAQMINDLWQDLTEEEKQQVKGILECQK